MSNHNSQHFTNVDNLNEGENEEPQQEQTIIVVMDYLRAPISEFGWEEPEEEEEIVAPQEIQKEAPKSLKEGEEENKEVEGEAKPDGDWPQEDEFGAGDEYGEGKDDEGNGLDIPSESLYNEPVQINPKLTVDKVNLEFNLYFRRLRKLTFPSMLKIYRF